MKTDESDSSFLFPSLCEQMEEDPGNAGSWRECGASEKRRRKQEELPYWTKYQGTDDHPQFRTGL